MNSSRAGEVAVGGVGHHPHHPCHFAEHDGVRAAGPSQLEPGADRAVADGTSRAPPDRVLGDDLVPRLYVEPVGQGDSDKPREYRTPPSNVLTWSRGCGGTTACAAVPCQISRPALTSLTCAGLLDWQTILVGRTA
jgi:hypothetical protein